MDAAHVRFSNRPFEVKHFQTIHHCSVDVAHGLALLFGIGTKALPAWDPRTRWNNLWVGFAVRQTAGPSGHVCRRLMTVPPHLYGTHSLRRTKATLIYRRTGNLRAVQLLLGHTKIESTVRYLGIEVDDAIAIAEQVTSKRLGRAEMLCPTSVISGAGLILNFYCYPARLDIIRKAGNGRK